MTPTNTTTTPNRVKARRLSWGWSQAELAHRAGISRTAVSAIEGNRLVPSVAAALGLAGAMECSVEELFSTAAPRSGEPSWAWAPLVYPCRFWQASVGEATLRYPAEATAMGVVPHDGVHDGNLARPTPGASAPEDTLVVACCDPAVGLLASQFARATGYRLIALPRSSRKAMELLKQGVVHLAGLHLSHAGEGNLPVVREEMGTGYRLLRAARWQEGISVSPHSGVKTIRSAVHGKRRWVGREAGSGARQCLDELLGNRQTPTLVAHDHRGVADAVSCGWADVGVCLRLTSEEAGLRFLNVREEAYDLCYPDSLSDDPRMQALLSVLRSPGYRQLLGELPGYDASTTGQVQEV
jgi:molybdate-binding protein/DNA-binding XRE family transcriptional regulator